MEQARNAVATPTRAHTERHQKAIWKPLEAITARGYQPYDVFSDWLDLMTYALQRRDPEYLKIIRRYPNDREIGHREADYYAQAFGALTAALQTGFQDYLGMIYEEHISTGHLSQIFTPESLSQAIAEMSIDRQDTPFTVCDPACGSGRLLIEAVKQGPVKYACGIDLDARCAKMTALNLLFMNINAVVVCGNTLTDDMYTAYEITRTEHGGLIREAPTALFPERKIQPYLNRALSVSPMLWEVIRDKRFFWQESAAQTPAPVDPVTETPTPVEVESRPAVPLRDLFTPLARIQQRPVEKALSNAGIRKRKWLKSQQRHIGDYDIEKVDGYTLRITPWFSSAHSGERYALRLENEGYEVTADPDQDNALIVRKPDHSPQSRLDFG